MLHINLTDVITDKTIIDIDSYFDSVWEPEWIDNDFAKAMIADVDKSTVIAPRIIDSPFLGYVDPTWIAGGTKCVLCLLFDSSDWIFDITVCGDNCAKWIQRVAAHKELTVQLCYPLLFCDDEYFPIHILNEDKFVNSRSEFLSACMRLL